MAGVLAQYPIDFLYGNLAADISMAKKYAPVGRHCHHWHVADEMYEAAGEDERLQSAMLGYQCHLAADVLAHNSFVPRMLLLTSRTRGQSPGSSFQKGKPVFPEPTAAAQTRWSMRRPATAARRDS